MGRAFGNRLGASIKATAEVSLAGVAFSAVAGKSNDEEFSLVYVVGRVNQGIRRAMNVRLAEFGVSVQEYTTLSVLQARPGLSNAQLARRSLVAPQSMIEILRKLEQRGLVARAGDPHHGRILRAALTPKAVKLLKAADPVIREVQDAVFEALPPKQRVVLKDGLIAAMQTLSAVGARPQAE